MQIMEVSSWDLFKNLISSKSLLLQYEEIDNYYSLFAPEAQMFLWHINITKETDEALDFEINFLSNSNKPLEYRSVDGLPKYASAMFVDNLSYWVDGSNGNLTVASGQTGYLKTHFSIPFKLNGVDIHWENSNFGDYINFEVGIYNNNDNSSEDNFISFSQFANQYRIMGTDTKMFQVDTVKTIPSIYNGLDIYIRTTYVNIGNNTVNLCVNLLGYK